MDKSVGSSCSETKSTATQTEDPLITLVTNLQLEDDKNTTPTSPIKESGTMQDEDDDSTCSTPMQPPTSPSKNSLPLKTSSSNPMDTSIETTYSKTPSADSTTEDSEYPQYHTFHPRVVNLTDIEFNKAERALLNKYLKFIIEPKFNRNLAVELLSDATLAGEDLKPNAMWRAKYELWDVIENELENKKNSMINQKFRAYKSTFESINKKLEGNAVARKADEDDFIVIINKEKYSEKIKSYFSDNCITKIHNITTDFKDRINKSLKSKCSFLNEDDKAESRLPCPIAPELITLIKYDKDKKDDISIRPFINTENSPAYKLAMKLDKLIMDNYVFSKKYSVSSSMDLIHEIKNKPITNSSQLVSLSIKNLYANVPVDKTIRIVKENLTTNRKFTGKTIEEIVLFMKMVATYNYFEFNKKFYQQANVLTFGSCLSDTMAEIFINNLEQTILEDGNLKEIVYYGRIVDKILLVVNGTDFDINKFRNAFFDKSGGKIDFSVELEINKCIQFLDLNIIRLQNQLTFNVFRKSTTTDLLIPNDSCHPKNDKEGAFRSLLSRAYNMPMSEKDRLYELNIIKQIAHSNGYEMDMVDLLWDDVRRNNEAEQINVEKKTVTRNNEAEQINVEKKTVTVPYYGKLSKKLADIFKPYNVKFDFQAKKLKGNYLMLDLGYRNTISDKPGVYKFRCKAEGCTYIGETGIALLKRVTQQEKNNSEPVGKHIAKTGHHPTRYILHIEKNDKRRELLEKFQIEIHYVKDDSKLINSKIHNTNKFFDGFETLFESYYKSKLLSHPTN